MHWYRGNGEVIQLPIEEQLESDVAREIAQGHHLRICIGSDSKIRKDGVDYATALVVVREKQGAFMFLRRWTSPYRVGLRERMMGEVSYSIELAYALAPLVARLKLPLEIHADINRDPAFQSHVAFKAAMGYILGMGFIFRSKPEAFASSSCADKAV
jgi:predicted RNase H-related nuclease YkuK (DUF458 family)